MAKGYGATRSIMEQLPRRAGGAAPTTSPIGHPRPGGPAAATPPGTRWNLAGFSVLPICLAAVLGAVNPNLVYQGGLWLAAAALLASGRIPRIGPADYLAILICCWASATLMWSRDIESSQIAVRAWWTVALLLIAARHVLSSRRRLLLVAGSYLAGAGWTAVELIRASRLDETALRVSLEGVGVNYTAYCLVTAALVTVLLLVARVGVRPVRAALWLLLPLFGYGTMLTGTRASQIALVAVAAYLVVDRLAGRTWAFAIGVSAALLVLVPFGHLARYQPQWLANVFDRPLDDLSGRLAVWPVAEASFWDSPLVGIGAGAFPSTNPYYGVGAHSLVLTLGNDLGVIGMVMFAALIGFLIRDAAPWLSRQHGILVGALIVGWTPIWVSGHWEISPVAWLTLALWSRLPVALAEPPVEEPPAAPDRAAGRPLVGLVR
ncbi:O-antigen ligase family protein [Micromonospora orduensis]|uniref:O-antigen ligase family protein n=1 Tax=Micromonospora orduensis TaxID=1420891 RepID=A0A5C4QPV0_9ACTN|nr:O-antigen ligase family protein [Micromonospora orduensis]TNH27618.1 O-antigen ligase family protein [Micromonospora orduensis]